MRMMSPEIGTLHFIGIGGIGMSGIAMLLVSLGYDVQGSDVAENGNVKRLRELGVRVYIGHDASNLKNEDEILSAAVVVSSAISDDNPELIAARVAKVPVARRAEMLAELMRLKTSVAVTGTHGKTTTTSMVGQMLDHAGLDPTVVNGGIVNAYGTNMRLGQSQWMVVEADESDGSFTALPATVGVVTNIDPEHMDHYGSFEEVQKAYRQFILGLPFYGYGLLCIDHPEVQKLVLQVKDRKIITYGFNPKADIRAENVRFDKTGNTFDAFFAGWLNKDGQDIMIKDIHLSMLGIHNVQNSLAALGVANEMGIKFDVMKQALNNFGGVKRRFTNTGEIDGITIIDDYAHHPVEIGVVLKTARHAVEQTGGHVIAVMQPHRYTRLKSLYEQFCGCFSDADHVIVADVYEASEEPIEGINKEYLVEGLRKYGHPSVCVLPDKDDLARMISETAESGDFVIIMGAGDSTHWAYALPEELEIERIKSKEVAA
ncbi:MAG: UDP-N-acetylmuramate--L-alanine ligase [Alphaproteobacteria bacterium]|nr:UDP-N-acetylmuramate--L-alanine ligase [Alphaproteobacteria bacterium]